jgi:hypothetical protein
MSPHIPEETMEEVKQEVEMKAKTRNSFVFHIKKEFVREFFNYGKPQYVMARIIGKQLAFDLWGISEQEAIDRRDRILEKNEHSRLETGPDKDEPYLECRCDKDLDADVWQITVRKKDWKLEQ